MFGIVIPVLVLVTTIIMASISFAWFSQETDTTIQSINLSTSKAFVLEFNSTASENNNLRYRGQKAIDENQQLVSPFSSQGSSYTIDAPYYFISPIQISTGEKEVSLRLLLEGVEISNDNRTIDTYAGNPDATNKRNDSDIPLAFTWFFKAHPDKANGGFDNSDNLTPTLNSNGENMKPLSPEASDVWYTPYGKMEFQSSKLTKINDEAYDTSSFSIEKVQSTVDIKGFSAAEGTYFDFYIIFAPEKLFWSHILKGDYTTTITALYDEAQQKEIYGKFFETGKVDPDKYAMYYSDQGVYQGSHFKFGASLNVTEIADSQESPEIP